MIPERYDTMVWGIILLIALTFCTVAMLHAIDRLEGDSPNQPVRREIPMIQTHERGALWAL
jgi:hypothetical protein